MRVVAGKEINETCEFPGCEGGKIQVDALGPANDPYASESQPCHLCESRVETKAANKRADERVGILFWVKFLMSLHGSVPFSGWFHHYARPAGAFTGIGYKAI